MSDTPESSAFEDIVANYGTRPEPEQDLDFVDKAAKEAGFDPTLTRLAAEQWEEGLRANLDISPLHGSMLNAEMLDLLAESPVMKTVIGPVVYDNVHRGTLRMAVQLIYSAIILSTGTAEGREATAAIFEEIGKKLRYDPIIAFVSEQWVTTQQERDERDAYNKNVGETGPDEG